MTRAQRFRAHLDTISGKREPRQVQIASTKDGVAGVTVLVYDHVPEPGMCTGITYGLSLVDHPLWTAARAELCLTVATMDDLWMYALGEIAERLRGANPFVYGSTVDIGDSVDEETGISAFLVFAPAVLDRRDFERIELGPGDFVSIVGLYPIHESERRFIAGHGLAEFWRLHWDMYDVHRGAAV